MKHFYKIIFTISLSFFYCFSSIGQCDISINAIQDLLCNGDTDGSIQIAGINGTAPYTYSWDANAANQTTATATGLAAGTYAVTVTDFLSCVVDTTITISEPTPLSASAAVTSNYNGEDVSTFGACDGEVTANPTGGVVGYAILWDAAAGFQTTFTASNLCAGNYCATVTDANGCEATNCVTVTEPSTVTATIISTLDVLCTGNCDGEATVDGTGGVPPYSYIWDGATGNQTTATVIGLCEGPYFVTVTDANGATASTIADIHGPLTPLNLSVIVSSYYNGADISAFGACDGEATANPTGGVGGYVFLWDVNTGSQNTAVATNLCSGNYCVTATDANGCTATNCVTLTEPSQVTATITAYTDVLCNGNCDGTATGAASGGVAPYNYIWDDPLAQATATATNLCAGIYTVSVTDANGATATNSVTISEPSALTLNVTVSDTISVSGACDGEATATINGGTAPYMYQWDDPGSQTLSIATNLCAGVYCVTVTDPNNCTISDCVTITEPSGVTATIANYTDPICHGDCTGSATVTGTGGLPPYTYLWDSNTGSQNSAMAVNLCDGIYFVTVTDLNGDSDISSVTITNPPLLVVNPSVTTNYNGFNVSAFGACDGKAVTNVTGGLGGYTFQWDDPLAQTTDTLYGACGGMYCVTVFDANGCTATDCITVTEPSNVYTSSSQNYLVAPDSAIDFCATFPPNTTIITPSGAAFGTLVLNGPSGCYTYTANGFAEILDSIVIEACTGTVPDTCHTTTTYITTATCVWAGDANDDNIADNFDVLPVGLSFGYTATSRPNAGTDWDCEPSLDWPLNVSGGVNMKHSDTDGSGLVTWDDTLAINQNWSQTHLKSGGNPFGIPIYIDTATSSPGQTIQIPIILGTGLVPASDVYGVAFTIEYDEQFVDTGSVYIDFSNSWMGTHNVDLIGMYKDYYYSGQTAIGMSRTDHIGVPTGMGPIATMVLTIKDDVMKAGELRMDFDIHSVLLIDSLGMEIDVSPQASQVLIITSGNKQLIKDNSEVLLFPNPANNQITIQAKQTLIEQVQLFDLAGRKLVQVEQNLDAVCQINTTQLPEGVYIALVHTPNGIYHKRCVIVR